MGNPIINPWLIYGIELTNNLLVLVGIAMIVFALLALFLISYSLGEINSNASNENKKKAKKYAIICIILSILNIIIFAATPSKETCYKMLVANYATYENVDKLGENAKDTVDYIFDKIEEVQNESTNSEKNEGE